MSRKIGRPTVLDEKTVSKLLVMLGSGYSVSAACYQSGISRESYYYGLQNSPSFSHKIACVLGGTSSLSRVLIISRIQQGDVATAKWWLRLRCRSEFG